MMNKTNVHTKYFSRIHQSQSNKVNYTALAALLLLAVPIPRRFITEQQQLESQGADGPLEKQSWKIPKEIESFRRRRRDFRRANMDRQSLHCNNDNQNNLSPNPLYNNKYSGIEKTPKQWQWWFRTGHCASSGSLGYLNWYRDQY